MLTKLVSRLHAPTVISNVAKEELCLSFAALCRLYVTDSTQSSSPSWLAAIAVERSKQLEEKVKQISFFCSPQEVSMLSDGALALSWKSTDLIDSLAMALDAKQFTILQVTALLRLAISVPFYSNCTLRSLIVRLLKNTNFSSGNVTNTEKQFLLSAAQYLGRNSFMEVTKKITESADEEPLKLFVLDLQSNFAIFEPREDVCIPLNQENTGATFSDRNRARYFIFHHLTEKGVEKRRNVLVSLLEIFAFFQFKDPEALRLLEADAIAALQKIGEPSFSMRVRNAILKASQTYSEATKFLRTQANHSDQLVIQNPLRKGFVDILQGNGLDAEVLLAFTQQNSARSPTEDHDPESLAFSLCICSFLHRFHEDDTIFRLTQHLGELNADAVCSVLLACKLDRHGSLRYLEEKTLEVLQSFPLGRMEDDEIMRLIKILSFPKSRWVQRAPACALMEDALIHTIGAILMNNVTFCDQTNIFECIEMVRNGAIFDVNGDFIYILARKIENLPISVDLQLRTLELFGVRDFIPGPSAQPSAKMHGPPQYTLLASIAASLAVLVERKLSSALPIDAEEAARDGWQKEISEDSALLLRLMFIQCVLLDAPELGVVSRLVLNHLRNRLKTCSLVELVAIGFAALNTSNYTLSEEVQRMMLVQKEQILDCQDEILWCFFVKYLYHSPDVKLELVQLSQTVLHSNIFSSREPAIIRNLHVAQATDDYRTEFIALYNKLRFTHKELPPLSDAFLNQAKISPLSISSKLYTSLCIGASSGSSEFCARLIETLPQHLDYLSPSQIATCVSSLSDVEDAGQRLAHQVAMELTSVYVMDNVDLFYGGPDICKLLRGFSALHCTKRNLYNVLSSQLKKRAVSATMDRESISTAIYAFGLVKFLDKDLIDKYVATFLQHANALSAADLLLSIKGCSRLTLLHDDFYDVMGKRVVEKLDQFQLISKYELLQAYGEVGVSHDALAAATLRSVISELQASGDVKLSLGVLESLWYMDYKLSPEEMNTFSDIFIQNRQLLGSKEITEICSILVDQNWKSVPTLQALAKQSMELAEKNNLQASACRAILDTLSFFSCHDAEARKQLSPLARAVSKETYILSDTEKEQIQALLAR